MKKKIGIVLAVVLGISALGFGVIQSNATEASPKMDRKEIEEVITSQYPGEITELELDKEGTRAVYEAEIVDKGKEYELKLDGDTGDVLELDEKHAAKESKEQNETTDKDKNVSREEKAQNETKKNNNKKSSKSAVISTAQAEKIAKKEFDGTLTDLELDEDDGRLYYEIDMKSKDSEAEIEIDAYTGDIITMEIEEKNDDDDDERE